MDVMSADDLFEEDVKQPTDSERVKSEKPTQDEEMEDLFGDAEEESQERTRTASPAASVDREGSEALSASELRHRKELEYEEDEVEDQVVELKHAVLELPNLPMPRSSDGIKWLLKMPNFVKLDPKPFDPETYVGPETEGSHEKEKTLSTKLEVENTIRWRWRKDTSGQQTRQSNSRIIRWSDGSLSLLLGKELFDINQTYEGTQDRSASQSQSQTQTQSQSQSQNAPTRGAVYSYLVAQHKRAGILQAEAPINGHMTLRPTGMQSETHRKLARAVGQKHSRVARLRIAPDSIMAQEQQELLASQKKTRRPRAAGDAGVDRRKRRSYGRRRESVWSDDEPELGTFGDTDEDDEAGYDGTQRKSRRLSGENQDHADGKRGSGDYQTDDFLVADSDEEDEEEGGKRKDKKRTRRSADKDGGEPDALDELDAKIARQEEENRRRKRAAERTEAAGAEDEVFHEDGETKAALSDVDMEVESESEEEEVVVRRTGGGSRKKRAIAVDEDDEE